MSLANESFQQSKCLQFSQSACLMRVAGIVIGVEWRMASYMRQLPGFMPIFPDENGTLTGQALELSKRRRFHGRTVTSSLHMYGFQEDPYVPGLDRIEWDSDGSFVTQDAQTVGSLVPTTSGGHSYSITGGPPYSVAVTSTSKFFDGDKLKGSTDPRLSPKGATEAGLSIGDSNGGLTEYRRGDGSVWYQSHYDNVVSETREGEPDYVLEVDNMREVLAGVDMARLWTLPPGSGLNRLNHNIYYDQFLWHEGIWAPFDPDTWGITNTGDIIETDTYSPTGLQNSTYISYGWGRHDVEPAQAIIGSRLQFRCSIPINYSIIERVVTGEGGYGRCYIHADSHEAAGGEIVEVPMGTTQGDGLLPITGDYQALGTQSAISVHLGKTAAEALAIFTAANGVIWVPA